MPPAGGSGGILTAFWGLMVSWIRHGRYSTPMETTSRSRLPAPSGLAGHWLLDPETVFLNHGSFGACPRAVLEEQSRLRQQMEREPVTFFIEELPELINHARYALADFVGCRGEDLVFVPNATTGVATIFAHLREHVLTSRNEILVTSHEYPACINNVKFVAGLMLTPITRAEIPFPVRSESEIVQAVLRAVTERTAVALLSHVTAPTGIVLPIARLVKELESRGIITIIDGAHAPGMVDVALDDLGASFYTANCHKWLCAPRGAAFLHVRHDRQAHDGSPLRPLVLSNNAERPAPGRKHMLTEFDYTGTQDFTSWACIPAAIRVLQQMVDGGWPGVRRHNHDLAVRGRDIVCGTLGIRPPAPENMLGSMATIILPPHDPDRAARLRARPTRYHDALQDALLERHRIQVPIWGLEGSPDRFIRLSAQLYNTPAQYDYLARALVEELEREASI